MATVILYSKPYGVLCQFASTDGCLHRRAPLPQGFFEDAPEQADVWLKTAGCSAAEAGERLAKIALMEKL